MRLLLALLALLSGLAVPQAVAAATSVRADSSVVSSQSLIAAPACKTCPLAQAPLGKVKKPTPTTIWLPTVALIAPATVFYGDRARE